MKAQFLIFTRAPPLADEGGSIEIHNCRLCDSHTQCRIAGVFVSGEGSTLKLDGRTSYCRGLGIIHGISPFAVVVEGGTLLIQCGHLDRLSSGIHEDDWLDHPDVNFGPGGGYGDDGHMWVVLPPPDHWAMITSDNFIFH